jgi:hypothetical protein
VTARGAQLRDNEVLGPEQADVDGISGVWGVPAKCGCGAERFVRFLRWRVGAALFAVTRRRHGNLPDGTAEPDEASKQRFGRLAFPRTSALVSPRALSPPTTRQVRTYRRT